MTLSWSVRTLWITDTITLRVSLCASSLGSSRTTSSYLCPWVKVLRQHVRLSLCLMSHSRWKPLWCGFVSFVSHVNDTLFDADLISLRHKQGTVIMWRSNSSRRLRDYMLLVQMVHDKFLGLIKLWRLGKLKQTDSALFWLLREPHVQSGNFILHTSQVLKMIFITSCSLVRCCIMFLLSLNKSSTTLWWLGDNRDEVPMYLLSLYFHCPIKAKCKW